MERFHEPKDVRLDQIKDMFLIKVPKHLKDAFENGAPGSEIGKLKCFGNDKIAFVLTDKSLLRNAPKEHEFVSVPNDAHYSMYLMSQGKIALDPSDANSVRMAGGEVTIIGSIKKKAEIRPVLKKEDTKCYLERMKATNRPVQKIIRLNKEVHVFKPKSNHEVNIEYINRKKDEGKNIRADKDLVMEQLFCFFQKHQYYQFKDLVTITKQPAGYLKEILKEICIHNVSGVHRGTYELRKEFRYYKEM